jgi:predicted Zn-dependent protease
MSTRFVIRCVVSAAVLAVAASASAQFGNLDKLTKALDKTKKGVDTYQQATKVAKGFTGIGPKEEEDLGDTVALELITQFGGLVRDEEIVRRMNLIGRSLTLYSDRPERHWRFGVLASDTVNGFSAPDGYVLITRGLYNAAKSDDELAGVLAHEISHVTRRNALHIIERDDAFKNGTSLLVQHSSDARKFQGQVQQVDAYLNQLGLSSKKIVKTLVSSGFDAPTEYDADRVGRDLASTAGYAPGGLRAVLTELQTQKGDPKKLFPTHPPLAERLKKLPNDPAP